MAYPPTDHQWLEAALSWAGDGDLIDLDGRVITCERTVILDKRVTLRNGTLTSKGFRTLLVNHPDVRLENMTCVASGGEGVPAVYVQAEMFISVNTHYFAESSSALVFQHGTCDHSFVQGGSAGSASRRQNACGVYVSAGNKGNRGITIDGVTVRGGTDRGPDGIIVYDAAGCTVRNCVVTGLVALPEAAVTGWTDMGGGVYQSGTVRVDGPTRALLVDGGERSEHWANPTQPAPNTWGTSGGRVYLNLGGLNPADRTVVSRIVSGYGITLYCTAGEWRTMSNNTVADNHVEDVDGFGIYLQLGDTIAVGNTTRGNTLINTCRKGVQSWSLPFSALGVIGGTGTLLDGDVIDGAGATGDNTPGVKINWSNSHGRLSGGTITGARVRNATGPGVQINGGDWKLTNTTATGCGRAGFTLHPEIDDATIRVEFTGCEATHNGTQGISVEAHHRPMVRVHLTVNGGTWAHNGSPGLSLKGVDTCVVGGGAFFDGNRHTDIDVSLGCGDVHVDGIVSPRDAPVSIHSTVRNPTVGRVLKS